MSRIQMNMGTSIADTFDDSISSCQGRGLSEETIASYRQHFHATMKFISMDIPIEELAKEDLDQMIIQARGKGLATNSICSYVRTIKAFLSWCTKEKITDLNVPLYKQEETIKETYSDAELVRLLKKPNMRKCKFSEYRDWVIENLLVNSGCRAASIRNIQNRDVDLENNIITLRHTKTKKVQVLPLCLVMVGILKEYMRIRKGEPENYLFSNNLGEQLTENGLRCSIADNNKRRGVSKTSIISGLSVPVLRIVQCGISSIIVLEILLQWQGGCKTVQHLYIVYKNGKFLIKLAVFAKNNNNY